eukprot:1320273-Pleurochrysis_carterae.AAC.2
MPRLSPSSETARRHMPRPTKGPATTAKHGRTDRCPQPKSADRSGSDRRARRARQLLACLSFCTCTLPEALAVVSRSSSAEASSHLFAPKATCASSVDTCDAQRRLKSG